MQYDPEITENTFGFYRLPTVLTKIPISREGVPYFV